jgi:TetR/AcrR family transcriptional regulator, cholesterol catabolism regulator
MERTAVPRAEKPKRAGASPRVRAGVRGDGRPGGPSRSAAKSAPLAPSAIPRVRRAKTEDNLETLLSSAAALMARRGYEKTSIRDVARETGFSLAGMYYYFQGKEELLHKIQAQTFGTLLAEQEELARREGSADEKLGRLVENHLSYLTTHANELKVCTFELESLAGDYYKNVERLRKRYYKLVASLVGDLMGCTQDQARDDADVRHHTLFLFGMLNWVFMWFDPKRDQPTGELGRSMLGLILHGLPKRKGARTSGKPSGNGARARQQKQKRS